MDSPGSLYFRLPMISSFSPKDLSGLNAVLLILCSINKYSPSIHFKRIDMGTSSHAIAWLPLKSSPCVCHSILFSKKMIVSSDAIFWNTQPQSSNTLTLISVSFCMMTSNFNASAVLQISWKLKVFCDIFVQMEFVKSLIKYLRCQIFNTLYDSCMSSKPFRKF